MQFTSFEFLVFLPAVFLLYWFVFRARRWQNLLVVAASYVFYGWWDWRFLLLIAATSLCSFASGILIERHRRWRRAFCASNIVLNLLILGLFKYFNFFAESLADVCALFGHRPDWVTLHVVLPVGISFYTFQALSYTIDVYRGEMRATRDVVEFFAFISFFPQLVAGPIERATNLLPQFQRERSFDYATAVDGLRQMLWGLLKKLVVADTCAGVVNMLMQRPEQYPGGVLLLCGVLFAFQIYGDFSGYSDIAVGCAKLFGIRLMRNFRLPYFSRNVGDFWRRWHVSLMTWLRDYVYIPLGGSRCGRWKTLRNTFAVFALSGLWHGANWTFVVWGLYHAFLLSLYRLFRRNTAGEKAADDARLLPSWRALLQMAATFLPVVLGWLVFRAESMGQVVAMFRNICSPSLFVLFNPGCVPAVVSCLLLVAAEWLTRRSEHPLQCLDTLWGLRLRPVRWLFYYVLVWCCLNFAGQPQTFIYFQF